MLKRLYDWFIAAADKPSALWIMGAVSFAESSFFPIPPDVMLVPMTLARPQRGLYFATLCTLASVGGGLLGYLLGMFAFELVQPLLQRAGYQATFEQVQALFLTWGFWIVLLAGFSPIPYKVFTIASGVMGVPFLAFLVGSIVGRGGRFYLVAGLIMWGGQRMEQTLRRYVEWLGWGLVLLAAAALAWLKLR